MDVSRTHTVDPSVVENPKTWWRWILSGDWKQGPPIVSILMRSATITSAADLAESRAATDLLVMPELGGVEIRDWKAFEPAVKAGWTAATAALADLEGPVTHLRLRRARKAALSAARSRTASETASGSSRPVAAGKRPKAAAKAPKEKRPASRRKAPSDTA